MKKLNENYKMINGIYTISRSELKDWARDCIKELEPKLNEWRKIFKGKPYSTSIGIEYDTIIKFLKEFILEEKL